jgi:hypothetical protein
VNLDDIPDGYRKIRVITIVRGYVETYVRRCDECPMFEDPDPFPCYCKLDPEHGNYPRSSKSVDVLGPHIPDNCPLQTMTVEVKTR